MTRVLIVDDERMVQKAYQAFILATEGRYTVVETIASSADALFVCRSGGVDLILMDIHTAGFSNGMSAAAEIKKKMPDIKIIITTSYTDEKQVGIAKEYGLDGFWFKDQGDVELIEVMDKVMAGEKVFPKEAPDSDLGRIKLSELTPMEINVVHALLEVTGNKQIAQRLFIEESTVKTHLKNICEKVGVKTKTELAVLAANSKIVLPRMKD